ncbi:hypothetical protein Mal33_24810 [Rosistilla oblonga]|uniref:Uncharacterized protein n=1 Tax=Rosistilla oblonga TaxID=2527990 RepID=A0A518ITV5_9BACT|nr:hypothetical protein Mal33_24810 [Rosistilla oblonga]
MPNKRPGWIGDLIENGYKARPAQDQLGKKPPPDVRSVQKPKQLPPPPPAPRSNNDKE